MERERTMNEYVYRMLLNTIYNGKYRFQENLPSLMELCAQYSVGRNTMRSVLLKLQEKGYVTLGKGSRAKVSFDIRNFDTNENFRQAMIDSRSMIEDVYYVLEWVMPSIGSQCLRIATPQQMEELKQRIKAFTESEVTDEMAMIDELMNVYLLAFSFLDNPILNDMFITMMSTICMPLIQNDTEHQTVVRNISFIKKTLGNSLNFVLRGNDFMFRKLITMLCKFIRTVSLSYVDRVTDGLTPQHEESFFWISNRSQEYLYAKLVMDIMNDIRFGKYRNGDVLPSLADLAKQYEVSERTSRKALKLLNEYHIVHTINGVGSQVQMEQLDMLHDIAYHEGIVEGLRFFRGSIQLLMYITIAVLGHAKLRMNQSEITRVAEAIEKQKTFTLEPFLDALFSTDNGCLNMIYFELKKPINWDLLLCMLVDYHELPYDFQQLRQDFLDDLRNRRFSQLQKQIHTILQVTMEMSDKAIAILENKKTKQEVKAPLI